MKTNLLEVAKGIRPETPKAYIFELVNGSPALTHVFNVNVNPLKMMVCVIDYDPQKGVNRDQAQTFLKFGKDNLQRLAGLKSGSMQFCYSIEGAKATIETINSLGGQPFKLGENLLSNN